MAACLGSGWSLRRSRLCWRRTLLACCWVERRREGRVPLGPGPVLAGVKRMGPQALAVPAGGGAAARGRYPQPHGDVGRPMVGADDGSAPGPPAQHQQVRAQRGVQCDGQRAWWLRPGTRTGHASGPLPTCRHGCRVAWPWCLPRRASMPKALASRSASSTSAASPSATSRPCCSTSRRSQ